jgi:hypothetical protein
LAFSALKNAHSQHSIKHFFCLFTSNSIEKKYTNCYILLFYMHNLSIDLPTMTLMYLEDGTIFLLFSERLWVSTFIHDWFFSYLRPKIVDLKDRLKCPTSDRNQKRTKKRSQDNNKKNSREDFDKKHVQFFTHLSFITLTITISKKLQNNFGQRTKARKCYDPLTLSTYKFIYHRLSILSPTPIFASPLPMQR